MRKIRTIFAIEISKDKKISDLENEVRKKLGPTDRNDFLRQIYPKEKPIEQKIGFFPILTRRLMMRIVFTSEFFPNE
jgi:hypothetical protein